MRDRKKRNIIIGSLCCLLVFMGIGYAILSQTLNISGIANMRGNWNVKITNMELLSENKTGRAEEVSHSFTDTTATFEANLYMPGDSIEYRVTVENQGNIDAVLKSITPTTTNKSKGIKFSHSEIDNTVLTAGKTITFTMKVEFLEDATSVPNVENVKYNLELVYVQYNGGDYTPAVETTEDACFMISDDGTLISYDKNCGTDIVIPAKINNIPVKRIANLASNGMSMAFNGSLSNMVYIFMNESKLNEYFEYLKKENPEITDEEIKKQAYVYGSSEYNNLNLLTAKDYLTSNKKQFKVSKDSSGTIKLEDATDDNYNIIEGNYCTTNEACDLLKEYYRIKDPARKYGITDSSYYEYVLSNSSYQVIDDLNYTYFYDEPIVALPSDILINSIDFSNAIYIDSINKIADVNLSQQTLPIKKVILPPNVETIDMPNIKAEEVYFPKNSITKVINGGIYFNEENSNLKKIILPNTLKFIGTWAFSGTKLDSVTIPASVVRIGYGAFYKAGLNSLTFEPASNLIAMYGDADLHSSFENNNLKSITIPASVQYIGSETFISNKLTSVSFEVGSRLKHIGLRVFAYNQLTNTGLGKLPSTLTNLDTTAFSNNANLTQITLTSPTDLEGWTNGSTVDGKTVVYER